MLNTSTFRPIHPFPARMAPEIALEQSKSLPAGSVILDPMTGSGTVVRFAAESGHRAIGFDLDPLAVLMTKVWTTPLTGIDLRQAAEQLIQQTKASRGTAPRLPWIDADQETMDFVDFWFGEKQRADLRRLAFSLSALNTPEADALRVALSRIIVTKKRGASLAWDVSHSRPHKVYEETDFDVMDEFISSAGFLAKRFQDQPPPGNVEVRLGDGRKMIDIASGSIDAIITSPPYLNALDYLRGHKLALVWLGYKCSEIRQIRSISIGANRAPDKGSNLQLADEIVTTILKSALLPKTERKILNRYVLDLFPLIAEFYRVLKSNGKAVLVMGNSCLKGVYVENALAVTKVAEKVGLHLISRLEREIPPSRRYLPPPTNNDSSDLNKRMRTESILSFIKQ